MQNYLLYFQKHCRIYFCKNAFKNNFFGFIIGWLTAITSIIVAATVALGFGGYLTQFIDLPITIGAVILIVVLSAVNFIGIKESAWANTIFALVTAAGLALIIFLGFSIEPVETIDYFEAPSGITGIILAFVLIFFAFIGFRIWQTLLRVRKPKEQFQKQ